jgi:cell division protein DivIC
MRHGGDRCRGTHAKLRVLPAGRAFEISFTRTGGYLFMTPYVVNARRIIITVYVVVLAALGVGAGAVFLDARAQYNRLKRIQVANQQKLADAQAQLREQEQMLQRLKTDPQFIERAIRERLKYAKPGEVIFRFPD